ncbi:MAG TPA: tryptophan synthase subunit alpha [Alphaproteobacteria bacterium]
MSRIAARFSQLKRDNRAGLITFTMAGDPDYATSMQVLRGLPKAGADIVEIGMMFSDPMADGPAIQAAGLRSAKAGASLRRTLDMVAEFRRSDPDTPVVLMGYYNPIYRFGVETFAAEAKKAGADGLIIVDLPPEEDGELRPHAKGAGLDLIRLATPTTDEKRLPTVLEGASGFLYYVAVLGITGTKSGAIDQISSSVTRFRKSTELPIAVGFGIKTPGQAAEIANVADAAVVGSALVEILGGSGDVVRNALRFVEGVANAVHSARRKVKAEA